MTVTLITGANKGLGYETARRLVELGHTVYAGSRSVERGASAAAELGARFVQIDVTDDASVKDAMQSIEERDGHLDILVNNAGIADIVAVDGITGTTALAQFDTNAVGTICATQAAPFLLRKSDNPVVVNVSSGLGSFWAVTNPERSESQHPSIVYGATKAAINMLTVQYAAALPQIRFNAVEPGFTATDLTAGVGGGRPVEEGAEVIVRLATIGHDGPTGTFHEDLGELAW